MANPRTSIDRPWTHDVIVAGSSGGASVTLDRAGFAGPPPVQALRDRGPDEPHRGLRMALKVTIDGGARPDAGDRAIARSREKYCSAWHSIREDIAFTVTWGREASA